MATSKTKTTEQSDELTKREVTTLLKGITNELNDKVKTVEKNINARLTTTNKDVKKVTLDVDNKIKTALEKQIKRLEKLNNLVKLDARIANMESRMEFVGERLRFLIHKETILTELSRIARDKNDYLILAQFHLAIMKAYNQEDEWWSANGHELEIGEWYTKIMKLLEE